MAQVDKVRKEIKIPESVWKLLKEYFGATGKTLQGICIEKINEELASWTYLQRQRQPKPTAQPNFLGRPQDSEEVRLFKDRVSRIGGFIKDYYKQFEGFEQDTAYYLWPLRSTFLKLVTEKDFDGMGDFQTLSPWSSSTGRSQFAEKFYQLNFRDFCQKYQTGWRPEGFEYQPPKER
jgi:hypothetical protein